MRTRASNRQKSTRAKKLAQNSNQPDVESSISDQNAMLKLGNKDRELAASEGPAQPVVTGKEIKQEIEVLNANSSVTKGLVSGGGEEVVANTAVELNIKEEVVVEVQNVESAMEERGTKEDEQIEGGPDENGNANEEDDIEKGELNVECAGNVDGSQLGIVPVSEWNAVEEVTAVTQTETLGHNNNVLPVNEGNDGEGEVEQSGNDEEYNEDSEKDNEGDQKEDEDGSVFFHVPLTDRKKQKDLEIFIGRLNKGAVEDDLIKVFGQFGEIKAARIVRNSTTNKSRGFAFIRYATIEQAKNALSLLKDGIEVGGKRVKISASQDNDTLCVGNICKTWTKSRVLNTLKSYGIEHIEEIHVPDDPKKEGNIKGFALLEFSTHSDAMSAFQRLRKPDAVFGCNRSAKVAFAQTPMPHSEDVMSQVKTVYVEGMTDAWNEEKLKEICKKYGEIVKVKLSRSLSTKRKDFKRKDFGFIAFTSQESALACVEGINNDCIGEGEVKVKASIAKPQFKGRLQNQGFRGGFKVEKMIEVAPSKEESENAKEAGSSEMKGHVEPKGAKRKGKKVEEEKEKTPSKSKIGGGQPNKHQSFTEGQFDGAASTLKRKHRKRKSIPLRTDGFDNRGTKHSNRKRPSKKSRGNISRKQDDNFRHPKRDPRKRKGPDSGADSVAFRNSYTQGYGASVANHHGQSSSAVSGSKRRYTDMEPHAGYLEPVVAKKSRPLYSGYVEPAVGTQGRLHSEYLQPAIGAQWQPHAGYVQPTVGTQGKSPAGYFQPAVGTQGRSYTGYFRPTVRTQGQPHTSYLGPVVGTQNRPHAGYLESTGRTQGQSHGGYLEPAVVTQNRSYAAGYLEPAGGIHGLDPYDPRASGHDGQGSAGSAYGGALPTSYIPNYTSYAGYKGNSTVSGYYQSSQAYLSRRTY
ncbi:uncharacterized protein LOC132312588 isoform X2 [Cornus florida]|uniref:uncharacterized protein LOC132312588 isoform X2 n=1 Tax=Cornus florida TaxID=4283 RepID=UPI00289D7EAE|nr:uncharacterized protein LOC132312588 isoform X2 [Cornus florida]